LQQTFLLQQKSRFRTAVPGLAEKSSISRKKPAPQRSAFHVRRDKAALFQWVQAPPGDRSSSSNR
jgi:hypothetical protein